MSKNGFVMHYCFIPKPRILVWYGGNLLQKIIRQPTYDVKPEQPLNSEFRYDESVIQLSDSIFETIQMLCADGEYCVAAMLASHFYESFTKLDNEFKATG